MDKMTEDQRNRMIGDLLDERCFAAIRDGSAEFFMQIMKNGFQGFDHMSDGDLKGWHDGISWPQILCFAKEGTIEKTVTFNEIVDLSRAGVVERMTRSMGVGPTPTYTLQDQFIEAHGDVNRAIEALDKMLGRERDGNVQERSIGL